MSHAGRGHVGLAPFAVHRGADAPAVAPDASALQFMALVHAQRAATSAAYDPVAAYPEAAAPRDGSNRGVSKAGRARAEAASAAANAFVLRPLTVCVRKRPLNREEAARGQFDVVSCPQAR
jgi:hypothetical protein